VPDHTPDTSTDDILRTVIASKPWTENGSTKGCCTTGGCFRDAITLGVLNPEDFLVTVGKQFWSTLHTGREPVRPKS
jgi:hypothetical protein